MKKEFRERTDKDYVGGLRDPALSLSFVPGWREVGSTIRQLISSNLQDESVDSWLASFGLR